MTYILILFIWAGNSGAITNAEYHTQESCEAAGKLALEKMKMPLSPMRYVCTEK